MSLQTRSLILALPFFVASSAAYGQDKKSYDPPPCNRSVDDYFAKEVWAKVGSVLCLQCHKAGGDAEESKLILKDPRKEKGHAQDEAMAHNGDAFCRMARAKEGDKSRMLVKVVGGLEHGGADILKPDSKGYQILAEFVRRINAPPTKAPIVDEKNLPPFFQGVAMLDAKRLLRRVTFSLAGRLPTEAEKTIIASQGMSAMPGVVDALMKEDAFYDRLREGFNDVFLTIGLTGNPEAEVLAYEHFTKTRLWTNKHDLSHVGDKK